MLYLLSLDETSLCSRRLEVVSERKNGRARGRHAGAEGSLSSRVSPSRAPVFSCAHYFQAPATQAMTGPSKAFKTPLVFLSCSDSDLISRKFCTLPAILQQCHAGESQHGKRARERRRTTQQHYSQLESNLDSTDLYGTSCSLKILGDYSPTPPPTA